MQGFFTNLVIFSVLAIGWLWKKRGILTPAGLKDLNALLFTLLMPVNFFNTGLGFNPKLLSGWRFGLVLIGSYVITSIVSWYLAKACCKDPKRRAASVMASVRPNTVFIGVPILSLWLGDVGRNVQLLYIAICTPYYNVIPLLMGQLALNGKADKKSMLNALLNTFENPVLIFGLLGLAIGGLGLTPMIPQWVTRTLKVIGDCGNGMALIVIGAALQPEHFFDDIKTAWHDMLMKLMLQPAIFMAVLLLFPLQDPITMRAIVVASAIPPAFNNYVLAKGFGMDGDYAAMFIASSLLLSMLTILFWMQVTTLVFA